MAKGKGKSGNRIRGSKARASSGRFKSKGGRKK